MISPGNLARFLRISTPMIVSNFKKSAFSVQPTIAHLFEGITKTSAKGLRFDFSEYDQATQSLNEEVLVYTPVLSLIKLRFVEDARPDMPKVQFETSRDSIYSQLTASGIMRAKLPESILDQLETANASLDRVDTTRSYFALRWQYQMSLTSKIASKSKARHPSFLVYYSFDVEQKQTSDRLSNHWTRQL